MCFSQALVRIKEGSRVTRSGWNGKNQWIAIKQPDRESDVDLPYIYLRTAQGKTIPWIATQGDLLADDWEVA